MAATNRDQVTAFLAEFFYQLADIHPFVNGNGRLATCMLNVFLRYFNLPSIILRYPGEKEDETSLYAQAIAEIDSSRALLQQLIKERISAEQKQPFVDADHEEVVCLQLTWLQLVDRIQKNSPDFNVNAFQHAIIQEFKPETSDKGRIQLFNACIQFAVIMYLTPESIKASVTEAGMFAAPKEISKTAVKAAFASLSKTEDSSWKATNKEAAGLVCWIELTDKARAEQVVADLKAFGLADIELKTRTDNKNWVVTCANINVEKLMQVATPAAVASCTA